MGLFHPFHKFAMQSVVAVADIKALCTMHLRQHCDPGSIAASLSLSLSVCYYFATYFQKRH